MTALLVAFAALALGLAALGVYGAVSYGVAQRTREIGIRMALGGRRGDILSRILRQGLAVCAAAIAIGGAAASALTRLMSGLLYRGGGSCPGALCGAFPAPA